MNHYKDKSIFNGSEIFSLLKKYKSQTKLKYVEKNELDSVYIDGKLLNFTVSDDIAFRFETDVDNSMALGCFNDKKTANILNDKFDKLFNPCKEIISL